MNVMNLLLNKKNKIYLIGVYFSTCEHKVWLDGVPLQDAHGRLSVFNQAHSAIAVPLVLDGDAAYLHHHLPQFFGCAAILFRTWEFFACWGQELTKLWEGKKWEKQTQMTLLIPPINLFLYRM